MKWGQDETQNSGLALQIAMIALCLFQACEPISLGDVQRLRYNFQ
jgi:hypothetical protein